MGQRGVTNIWLVDGIVRYPETLSSSAVTAAEAAVDALGTLPMVATVDVHADDSRSVVRREGILNGIDSTGPVARAISAPLERAMAIRPTNPASPTIAPVTTVLLAVRLRSRGTESDVERTTASLAGAEVSEYDSMVSSLLAEGHLRCRGESRRISLTAPGADRLSTDLAASTDRAGRADIEAIHHEFLAVNAEFLVAVSAWQTGPRDNDGPAIAGMRSMVDRLTPLLASLAGLLPRFTGYMPRFDRALGRSERRVEWLDSPGLDSVHTVWFELHEHLLATLGRTRTDER